jgi:hypothetical protein
MPRGNPALLKKWREACHEAGYLQKGAAFKPLPKKGTAAYETLRAAFKAK